jgi:hypothetical protein
LTPLRRLGDELCRFQQKKLLNCPCPARFMPGNRRSANANFIKKLFWVRARVGSLAPAVFLSLHLFPRLSASAQETAKLRGAEQNPMTLFSGANELENYFLSFSTARAA